MNNVRARRRGLVALVLVVSLSSGGCISGRAESSTVRVVTSEMKFSPASLTATANVPLVIVVDNRGEVVHTFSVNALGLEVKVPPGKQRRLTLDAPAAAYQYVCRILDHEGLGMIGQLVVT